MVEFQDKDKDIIDERLDKLFENRPVMIEKIRSNREFIENVKKDQVVKTEVKVFGVENVNVNAILKDNIWNRSIFTTDKLCRMFLGATLEQLKKYESKKRHAPFEHWFLILMIIFIGGGVLLVIVFLLPMLSAAF